MAGWVVQRAVHESLQTPLGPLNQRVPHHQCLFNPFQDVEFYIRLQAVISWIAQQPAVAWIAPRARPSVSNLIGTGICQTGTVTESELYTPPDGTVDTTAHTLWANGLKVCRVTLNGDEMMT
jgi:hypothetical protein